MCLLIMLSPRAVSVRSASGDTNWGFDTSPPISKISTPSRTVHRFAPEGAAHPNPQWGNFSRQPHVDVPQAHPLASVEVTEFLAGSVACAFW